MRPLLLAGLCLLSLPCVAQPLDACPFGSAVGVLETPDLRARLLNDGALFNGRAMAGPDGYLVPRASSTSPLYQVALWLSGTVGGEERLSATRYGSPGFKPGLPTVGGVLPTQSDCDAFDRIYVVSPADVRAFEAGGTPTADLAAWPVGLGAPAVTAGGSPVPVVSLRQTLDLGAGERPVVYGGPTAFWVMHDVPAQGTFVGPPVGVEVRVTAFAPGDGPAVLRQSTVYRYTVVNRNAAPIEGLHVGFFVDPDLGDAVDDYVGVDTTRGMAFAYNSDNDDPAYAVPPAVGVDVLSGLWAMSYVAGLTWIDDPSTRPEFLNRLRGLWNDGTPITEGGVGHALWSPPPTGKVTRFAFPGDPVSGSFWSERKPQRTGGTTNGLSDRRFMMSTPPVDLAPGASHTTDVTVVYAQGSDHLDSVVRLRQVSDAAQAAYAAGALFPVAGETAPSPDEAFALGPPQPNPARGTVRLAVLATGPSRLRLVDVLGRTVAEERLEAGAREARLDVSGLAPGAYVVVLESGWGRAVHTLTVVH